MRKYGINTPLRRAHFLAQMLHETAGLRYLEEVWGPTTQQLKYDPPHSVARNLGNTEPGDGFRFRGRGGFMLTGRANYKEYGRVVRKDLLESPDLVSTDFAMDSAAWFWDKRGLNEIADRDDVRTITRRINGGLTGYSDRQRRLATAKSVLLS